VFLPVTFVQRDKIPPRKDTGIDNDFGNEQFEDAVTHLPDNQPVSGPKKEGPAASKGDLHILGSKTRKSSSDILMYVFAKCIFYTLLYVLLF